MTKNLERLEKAICHIFENDCTIEDYTELFGAADNTMYINNLSLYIDFDA